MTEVAINLGDGRIVSFNPAEARTRITAHEARSMVEARMGHIDEAIEHADKAIAVQMAFVTWWDEQEKGQGQRSDVELRNRSVTKLSLESVAPDLDRMTVSRWRKALIVEDDPADMTKYFGVLEKAAGKIRKICGFEGSGPTAKQWTGEVEWYTPAHYIESARMVLGEIDLDPASSGYANRVVQAAQIFTAHDDGLAQEWTGRVWLNPPYKMPAVKRFCEKLLEHVSDGGVTAAIILTNNATDTSWWHQLTAMADCVCFPRGRISFYNHEGEHSSPTNGQNFHYFGPGVDAFRDVFSDIGRCMVRL